MASLQASQSLVIPTMPSGKTLRICIESTWGDKHYVGMSGLDMFDRNGEPIVIDDPLTQVTVCVYVCVCVVRMGVNCAHVLVQYVYVCMYVCVYVHI